MPSGPSITDWIIAGGTCVAAVSAVAAAIYTKRSASEAAKAAKAAGDQVELQRPRPIVIASFNFSLSDQAPNQARPDAFTITNIGNSPAFDIEISPIETPEALPSLGARSRLETEELRYLLAGSSAQCTHQLLPQRGGVLSILRTAGSFVEDAVKYFNEQSPARLSPTADYPCELEFTLSYRALDRRRFAQRYTFAVSFIHLTAWIAPVGSLLADSIAGQESPKE